jgi:phosphatidylglycerol---prolipoprotein diacylglyceryl transferase
MGLIGFAIMWRLRKKDYPDGKLFMIYLMLASTFRFLVEFLRLQPKLVYGLSEAQLIAIVLFIGGGIGMKYFDMRRNKQARVAA